MSKNKPKPILGQVKEAIDFVYEISNIPEGYHGSFNDYSCNFKKAISILVQRGIVLKERNPKHRLSFIYKWVPNMRPTDTLYKSVTQEMRDNQKKYEVKSQKKPSIEEKPRGLSPEFIVVDEAKEVPANTINTIIEAKKECVKRFDGVTDQELWDELKRRGASIVNGKLMIELL